MKNNALKLRTIIKNIGDVGDLNSDTLIKISYDLFKSVKFCVCVNVENPVLTEDHSIEHTCKKFNHHDSEHAPLCECCQTNMLTYYLGKCIDQLDYEDKLIKYNNPILSSYRIATRTYGFTRNKSIIQFRILRHHNAWNDPENMSIGEEIHEFDFEKISLKKLDDF